MQRKITGKNRCEVALLVDEETGGRLQSGRFVPDSGSMEAHLLKCLHAQYRNVAVVPFSSGVVATIEALRALSPGIVFNATEWVDGDRSLDAAIAGLLDMMKLRYTGSGPAGLQLARDKALSKSIVAKLDVAVPRHFVLERGSRVRSHDLAYPLIVKPQFGDGSEEIGRNSVVGSERALKARVRALRTRIAGPLLCEEFIEGRDLFVALLGNEPRVMPPLELVVGKAGASAPRLATYRAKHDDRYQQKWNIHYRRARLGREVAARIDETSRRIFHALKLRDYARIDYRLTPGSELVFLEANPNPDLAPDTFGRGRCFAGVKYPDLICAIVEAARRRPKY
jgi:D-alanine-D-alanine ligase